GRAATEWLRLRGWRSDEQITTVGFLAAAQARQAFADSTGEVRIALRTTGQKFGERDLVLEVIDNNPESSEVHGLTPARKADAGGVVLLEGVKGTWLRFGESMIHRLLPPGIHAAEMLDEERLQTPSGDTPEFHTAYSAMERLGVPDSVLREFMAASRAEDRDLLARLPWPSGVVGSATFPLDRPGNYVAAVAGSAGTFRAIGIGVGENSPFSSRGVPDGEPMSFLTAAERAWLEPESVRDGVHMERLWRAVKDSVIEAMDPVVREPISEKNIDVTIDSDSGTFEARLSTVSSDFTGDPVELVQGGFHVRDGIVLAVAWVPRDDTIAAPVVGDRTGSARRARLDVSNASTARTEAATQSRARTPWSSQPDTATTSREAKASRTPWDRAAPNKPADHPPNQPADASPPKSHTTAHTTPWNVDTPAARPAEPRTTAPPATHDKSTEDTQQPQLAENTPSHAD
ncbi:hypothetical protein, partial [Nocardia sp. NPDC019302]|uniref:hypothetical protein n=1 Tax=Nocardia sp. NPDC019302 TaxID=3154592 RepID=UPI003405D766